MPKIKKKNRTAPPPIDWLWAAMLERRAALGITLSELAKAVDVSYGTMRNYAMKSPWDWPRPMRERTCEALGIKVTVHPSSGGVEVTPE